MSAASLALPSVAFDSSVPQKNIQTPSSSRDLPVLVSDHRLGGVGTLCEPSDLRAGGVSQSRCNSSLGERALGCGRWSSALTEPFPLYVRSLTRAPLARSVERGAWRATRKHQSGRFKEPTGPFLYGSQ